MSGCMTIFAHLRPGQNLDSTESAEPCGASYGKIVGVQYNDFKNGLLHLLYLGQGILLPGLFIFVIILSVE